MAVLKNTTGQGLYVYAHDTAADAAKTGDAANITAKLSLDGGAYADTNDVNPTEIGRGVYWFALTQAETNAGALALMPVSATADVVLDALLVLTQEAAITYQSGDAYARLGAPAGASVSADIAAIEAQTDDIGVAGAGLTALGDTRLANLDAAVSTRAATGASMALTAAAVDAVWDELTAGHAFAGSTGKALSDAGAAGDPWAAAVRTLTQSAASVAATVAGSSITVTRGDTATIALTGLGDLSLRTKLWFTVKDKDWHTDAQSVLQIEETGGLLYLNGAATTTSNATLVVDDESAGNITITLKAAATAALTPGAYKYDIQQLTTTPAVLTETTGSFVVAADYTRAVS